MNQLALLHPQARRSVFFARDGSSSSVRGPSERRLRRPRSKNCRSHRQLLLRSEDQHQHCHHHNHSNQQQLEDLLHRQSAPETVRRLREQLEAVDRRLALLDSVALVSHQNAQAAAVRMMATYHQLTRRGYDATRDETATRFMRAMFVADVRAQDFTGRDVAVQQWEQLSRCHAGVRVDIASLDALPTTTIATHGNGGGARRFGTSDGFAVRSVGTTTLRISRRTLEHVFPHVLSDEPLAQWLIGKEYTYSYTLVLHVNASGQVFQLESRVDIASALLDLLQDPLATAKMTTAANVTRAGNLMVQSEVRDAQNTIENSFL